MRKTESIVTIAVHMTSTANQRPVEVIYKSSLQLHSTDSQPTRTNAPEGGGQQLQMIEILNYSPAMPKGNMVDGLRVFQLSIRCEMATRIEVRCVRKLIFVPRYCPDHPYSVQAFEFTIVPHTTD
jgi:hypothetical protein